MNGTQAPLVTWLYVPGDRPERFAKAVASGADAVILDLEDAVLPSAKEAARRNVRAFLEERGAADDGVRVHVRINAPHSEWFALDAAAVAAGGAEGVRVPKIESAGDVDLVVEAAGDGVPVDCLLESARGVENAPEIAAHPAVRSLALGEADLTAELGLRGDEAFSWLRTRIVVASAAAGLAAPGMAAYIDVQDTEGLYRSCLRGRDGGLFGRSAIHPRQVPVIRRAFTPSEEEVSRARQIAEAAEGASAESVRGGGAIALPDGRFIDAPVVAAAQRTLALAESIAERGSD
ncbi:CoA ester lyase [Nocardiopsis sp. L17-MgMaSL7]|uniref:HpcH/HpaI aldolase/citrate lyase family protein n=1 Tax=Nocardiopsis sp. L17-MgMaSL7 TaxID=1938893 RepID=UPI000D71B2A3|nr:CoA ester lyase [Nocardiopsis sp. L17-MgMaSL7]PWV57297.1 citrate lyase subunit beta/citryl-CoA lyase [Nocardiopsis sp. L17-MgMaSL7]